MVRTIASAVMFALVGTAIGMAGTTIRVQSPANHGIVRSPLHVAAIASGTSPIIAMQVYVDGVLEASSQSGSLSADIPLIAGNHAVVVYATNSVGQRTSQTLSVDCVIMASISLHRVYLAWNASTSPVMGYYIYRGPSAHGPFDRLNSNVEPATVYTDNSVSAGQTYYYVVTAADASAESAFSNVMRADIPAD